MKQEINRWWRKKKERKEDFQIGMFSVGGGIMRQELLGRRCLVSGEALANLVCAFQPCSRLGDG